MCGRFTETAVFDVLAERSGITVESGTFEALYVTMPDEQKKNADAVFGQMQRRQGATKSGG